RQARGLPEERLVRRGEGLLRREGLAGPARAGREEGHQVLRPPRIPTGRLLPPGRGLSCLSGGIDVEHFIVFPSRRIEADVHMDEPASVSQGKASAARGRKI